MSASYPATLRSTVSAADFVVRELPQVPGMLHASCCGIKSFGLPPDALVGVLLGSLHAPLAQDCSLEPLAVSTLYVDVSPHAGVARATGMHFRVCNPEKPWK